MENRRNRIEIGEFPFFPGIFTRAVESLQGVGKIESIAGGDHHEEARNVIDMNKRAIVALFNRWTPHRERYNRRMFIYSVVPLSRLDSLRHNRTNEHFFPLKTPRGIAERVKYNAGTSRVKSFANIPGIDTRRVCRPFGSGFELSKISQPVSETVISDR